MRARFEFCFTGVKGYEANRGLVRSIVEFLTKDLEEMRFYLGINEVVCNALRYGVSGPVLTQVTMNVYIRGRYLAVRVVSNALGFDVCDYHEKLKDMASNMEGDWAEYLRYALNGRGLWVMLTGADKVIYSVEGNEVVLITKIPALKVDRVGRNIVSRLFVKSRKKGMVGCGKS